MRSKRQVNRFVGENLKKIRIANAMKVQEVARRAGLPASSYSCLEGGWYNINLDNLFRILQVLGADIKDVWPEAGRPGRDVVTEDVVEQLIEDARASQPSEISVDDVLNAVSKTYGVSIQELASGSRKRKLSEARTVAAILVKEIPQLTLTQLSRKLGVHISSLSHCTKRLSGKSKGGLTILQRAEDSKRRLWADFQQKRNMERRSAAPDVERYAVAAM